MPSRFISSSSRLCCLNYLQTNAFLIIYFCHHHYYQFYLFFFYWQRYYWKILGKYLVFNFEVFDEIRCKCLQFNETCYIPPSRHVLGILQLTFKLVIFQNSHITSYNVTCCRSFVEDSYQSNKHNKMKNYEFVRFSFYENKKIW